MADFPYTLEKTNVLNGSRQVPIIKVQPLGHIWTEPFEELLPEYYNMKVRESDVWQIGLFKCGTTWATELIYCVYHRGNLTEAKSKYPLDKWMFLETAAVLKVSNYNDEESFREVMSKGPKYFTKTSCKTIAEAESPRFIRTHLQFSLLPPNLLDTCKVVYVCRNFKDMWISLYHFFAGGPFEAATSIEEYAEQYFQDMAVGGPICLHLKEALERRHHRNMFFLLYEDMKKDLKGVIRKMADFLNKELTEDKVDIIAEHLSFDKMKDNKYANMKDLQQIQWLPEGANFLRKGTVGQWKTEFSEELKQKYKDWWHKNMGDCDFKFPDDD